MKFGVASLCAWLALATTMCEAQEVIQVTWPTRFAARPPAFSKAASELLPAFRVALAVLPESNIVSLALSQPTLLGMTSADARRMLSLCGERYQLIKNDPVFRQVPSSLPHCYSERTPTNGLALVYRPRNCDSNTPCLLFLHGYGGSFLWYQHLLAEAFPDHLIVCPACGVSGASASVVYVSECITSVRRTLGHSFAPPTLVGLSAGGFGATRVYTQSAETFARLVLLAAYPPADTLPRFHKGMSVYAVAGSREDYVRSDLFRRSLETVRPRVDALEFHILPEADHYFLLARRNETVRLIRSWLK